MEATTQTIHPSVDDESVSIAVITALAATKDVDPLDIPPLSDTLDLEALNCLVASANSDLTVSFSIDGDDVTVTSDGTVTLNATR